jgi:hypothetical protein
MQGTWYNSIRSWIEQQEDSQMVRKPQGSESQSEQLPNVVHDSLGKGRLRKVSLGQCGSWVADVRFAEARRIVILDQRFWVTPVSEILVWAQQVAAERKTTRVRPKPNPIPQSGTRRSVRIPVTNVPEALAQEAVSGCSA